MFATQPYRRICDDHRKPLARYSAMCGRASRATCSCYTTPRGTTSDGVLIRFWEEFVPDVTRRRRQTNATPLAPSCLIDFLLSPIVKRPAAFDVTKVASLIFRPERRFLALTSFQSLTRPSLSFGSSSLISLRRQSLSLSRARLRPPGNIQSPSRFRLTSSTRPRFAASSFEDFAIPYISAYTEMAKAPL